MMSRNFSGIFAGQERGVHAAATVKTKAGRSFSSDPAEVPRTQKQVKPAVRCTFLPGSIDETGHASRDRADWSGQLRANRKFDASGSQVRTPLASRRALYRRFLMLLRMDIVNKFVQLTKLVQHEVGRGSEHVRSPRPVLAGAERGAAFDAQHSGLAKRPKL